MPSSGSPLSKPPNHPGLPTPDGTGFCALVRNAENGAGVEVSETSYGGLTVLLWPPQGDAVLTTPSLLMLGRGGTGGGDGTFTIKDAAQATIGDRISVGVEPGAKADSVVRI